MMESKLESCSVTSESVVGAEQHCNTLPEGSEKKSCRELKGEMFNPLIAWCKFLVYNKLSVAIFSLQK